MTQNQIPLRLEYDDTLVMPRIYVCSSADNVYYSDTVSMLRQTGCEVYDFRDQKTFFSWADIDKNWEDWNIYDSFEALSDPKSLKAFKSDFEAMEWANIGVLVMPAGKSAHMELGYLNGNGKNTIIYAPTDQVPPHNQDRAELLYLLADARVTNLNALHREIERIVRNPRNDNSKYIKKCGRCGRVWWAKSQAAKWCSGTCRVSHYQEQKGRK